AVPPLKQVVGFAAGSTTFSVSNAGNGTLVWSAALITSSSWARITFRSSGTNAGICTISYDTNRFSARTATIQFTAGGVSGSPQSVTISQAANPVSIGSATRTISGTTVSVAVTPVAGTRAWGVEETLPDGLTPADLTGPNANWNASARKLSWYATGAAGATLSYTVSGGLGSYTLSGTADFDGTATGVAGPAQIVIAVHPADINNDWQLGMSEAIAYLAGWQQGANPMNYAIRGAYLWQNGPGYTRQIGVAEPLCWVPGAVASVVKKCTLLAANATITGAVRTVTGANVTLAVHPPAGMTAWGVQENLPAGLTPAAITGPNATWSSNNQTITWYAVGSTATTLTYAVTGTVGTYTVSGTVDFDGADARISGQDQLVLPPKNLVVFSGYGATTPAAGTNIFAYGTTVTAAVTNAPVINGTTQYLCIGATVKGNTFALASPTNLTLTLTNNATLTWQWSTNYWLDVATNGNGSMSTTDGWWPKGSNVSITATAGDHALFGSWIGQTSGCTIKSNVITAPMTVPRAITANFLPAILVTTSNNPATAGTVTGGGLYVAGSNTVTLVAKTNVGWRFAGWSDGSSDATHAPVRNLTGDTNYAANFIQLGKVTTQANPSTGGGITGGGIYDFNTV
ncbi:MAG: hypothetical protein WCI73_18265, partial [Phycisphaerae bacterium]